MSVLLVALVGNGFTVKRLLTGKGGIVLKTLLIHLLIRTPPDESPRTS
jgi:hypothetical protein